jgi:hypothetical protein
LVSRLILNCLLIPCPPNGPKKGKQKLPFQKNGL